MLAARQRVLGPEHPATLMSAHNSARCLAKQMLLSKFAEAEELLRGVLAARQRIRGGHHVETLQTAKLLSMVQSVTATMH